MVNSKFRLSMFPCGKPIGDATMGQKGLGWKAQGWVSVAGEE